MDPKRTAIATIGACTVIAMLGVVLALALASDGDGADEPAVEQEQAVEVQQEEQAVETQQDEPASSDGELVYDGGTMRIYYRETKSLAYLGLDGMLQADFVVENLSDQECMIGPVMGECVCNGYNVTMTGGALTVSPGNKAACPLQLNYSAQTGASSFDEITTLSVKIKQTGDDILNPLAVATVDLQL